jgi:hypothetical protein
MGISFQWLCLLYVTFGSVFYGYDSGMSAPHNSDRDITLLLTTDRLHNLYSGLHILP